MSAGTYNLVIDQGSDFALDLVIKEGGTALNLLNYTGRAQLRTSVDASSASATFSVTVTNAAGGEEFCGDELADAESNTFYFEIAAGDSLICDDGGHPIYAGQYGPGADNAAGQAYEVHCEDHGDHDDH